MTMLKSDDPRTNGRPHAREKLRGSLFVISWVTAVVIATVGWFYFIAEGALSLVSWFIQ
jgi:hypothetical protein